MVLHRGALFDELYKIAEVQEQQPQKDPKWKSRVATSILAGGVGAGLGYGAASGLSSAFPAFFKNQGTPATANVRGKAAKVALPILGAAALMLGDAYRRRMDESFRSAPEWGQK